MSDWQLPAPFDYSPNGDDIDRFAWKTKENMAFLLFLLNKLKSGGGAGLDEEASAYETRVNAADNCIYMRNAENTAWIFLGRVEKYLGLEATEIGAIINGGGLNKITLGKDADKPQEDNKTHDLYAAYDTRKVYLWTGAAWITLLSLNFGDMLNYEKYCVAKEEVSEEGGKGKIPRLDEKTGKGNFDITGSPDRLLGYEIDTQELKGGDVLVFNAEKEKFVNLPNSALLKNGEPDEDAINRIINALAGERLDAASFAAGKIADRLNDIETETQNLSAGLDALGEKMTTLETNTGKAAANLETKMNATLAQKANLASPAFSGKPVAPTASAGANDTQIANTAFVTAALKKFADTNGAGITDSYFTDWSDGSSLKSCAGYVRFADGFVVQYGMFAVGLNNNEMKFPISFPSRCTSISGTVYSDGNKETDVRVNFNKLTRTGAGIRIVGDNNNSSIKLSIIAVGV